MSYFSWKPYVSVAERRKKASRKMGKLKKKGVNIQPIEIEKRKIAHTFWGKAWCDHIESFSDYDNRLPRGRTYVRNGSVCHLSIEKGKISAIVSGSSLYNIEINIAPLSPTQWIAIKKKCSGQIGSLLELFSGKLSDSVMNSVCDQNKGLFPTPNEIKLSCDCPDWATMCKHVAAVLYGVGARLDQLPHHLFLLRGVDHEELIDVSVAIADVTQKTRSKRQRIDDSALAEVFGIDIDQKPPVAKSAKTPSLKKKKSTTDKKKTSLKPTHKSKQKTLKTTLNKKKIKPKLAKKQSQQKATSFPVYLTGVSIKKKRKDLGFTQIEFATKIGVSGTTLSNWENQYRKRIKPKKIIEKKLKKIW